MADETIAGKERIHVPEIVKYVKNNSQREPDVLRRLYEMMYDLENADGLLKKTCDLHEYKRRMLTAPVQAQLIQMLLKLTSAKKAIEIGVYTGYNLLNVAMTIPKDGKVIGCDVSAEDADIGKPFFEEAGVMDKIDIRIQPALKTLDELLAAGEGGTFDFIYVDADKLNYDSYYERALQLLRPGGLIGIDNVLWGGKVTKDEQDEETSALHHLNMKIHKDKRVDISLIAIGDGLYLARKI